MTRVLVFLLLATCAPVLALAQEGLVYVVKPGKTALKSAPKLDAVSRGRVAYGQKLSLKKRGDGWLLVAVPGETLEGWISARAVIDRRPGLETVSVAGAMGKVAASEGMSTAGAIRGLDGRTAGYATAKQIPPEALSQLARLEMLGERLFKDPHRVDAKGVWHYRDATAAGRWSAARTFAKEEGLRVSPPAPPKAAPTATPKPTGTP